MPTTPTPNLGLALIDDHTEDGTWGPIVNENMELLDFDFQGWISHDAGTMAVTVQIPVPLLASTGADALGATTEYAPVQGIAALSATEDDVELLVNESGTLRRFRAILSAAPGTGEERVLTLRKNGTDTAIVLTFGAADDDVAELAATLSVAAGDVLAWKCADTNGAAAGATARFAMELIR